MKLSRGKVCLAVDALKLASVRIGYCTCHTKGVYLLEHLHLKSLTRIIFEDIGDHEPCHSRANDGDLFAGWVIFHVRQFYDQDKNGG